MNFFSNTRRRLFLRTLALTGLAGTALSARAGHSKSAVPAELAHRVVFQISDGEPKKWRATFNNIKNVQAALGVDQVGIEIVVHGPGIALLREESEQANLVLAAIQSGVRVLACLNTMRSMNLNADHMIATIGYVEAGVVEIIERQAEGFAYIHS